MLQIHEAIPSFKGSRLVKLSGHSRTDLPVRADHLVKAHGITTGERQAKHTIDRKRGERQTRRCRKRRSSDSLQQWSVEEVSEARAWIQLGESTCILIACVICPLISSEAQVNRASTVIQCLWHMLHFLFRLHSTHIAPESSGRCPCPSPVFFFILRMSCATFCTGFVKYRPF